MLGTEASTEHTISIAFSKPCSSMQTFLSKRQLKRDLAKDIVEVFYEKVNSQQNTDMVFESLSSSLQVCS